MYSKNYFIYFLQIGNSLFYLLLVLFYGFILEKYYLQIFFLLFTDLFCEFESSFCQWKLSGNEEGYSWFRNTSKSLKNLGISGPKSDNFNQTETYFVMTSNYLEEDASQAKAYLLSPIFKGSEQPVGCFKFWFNFGVSFSFAVLPTHYTPETFKM